MSNSQFGRLAAGIILALGLSVTSAGWAGQAPGSADPLTGNPWPGNSLNGKAISQAPPAVPAPEPGKGKRRIAAKSRKEEAVPAEYQALLNEIMHLKWGVTDEHVGNGDSQKVSLEKVFHETLQKSIAVRQAEAKVKDAEAEAKEIREPGLFGLLNPLLMDVGALKKAADYNIQAAQGRLAAVRQKALLDSAGMHAGLVRAFMGKYLSYQTIEQGKSQLNAEEKRFNVGETNSFDVTQTRMALIDRYGTYLHADNSYHAVSLALASQIDLNTRDALVPAGLVLEDGESGNASVPLLNLLPAGLTVDKAVQAAQTRPEAQEFRFRRLALEQLIKAASGLDKQRKQAEERQLELEAEKARNGAVVLAEKAFSEYRLAGKNLELARQRYELALQMLRQLNVSRNAGFSSSRDVLDGQVVLAQAKTNLINTQVAYNLSQIQLVYEMGLLGEDVGSHPLTIPPPNSL